MKKNLSKTIMVILAVLLTLVLISTSTVSGIFAKYVVEKNATTIVSLKKFGIKLTILKGAAAGGATVDGQADITSPDNNTLTVTIRNISLAPGESLNEVVKFAISVDEKVAVDTNIKIKAEVSGVDSKFEVGNRAFMPIGVKSTIDNAAATAATEIVDPWINAADDETLAEDFETALMSGIATKIGGTQKDGFVVKKVADANTTADNNLLLKSVGFGYFCPETYTLGSYNTDTLGTQIAQNDASISITYTVSLEQITKTNS